MGAVLRERHAAHSHHEQRRQQLLRLPSFVDTRAAEKWKWPVLLVVGALLLLLVQSQSRETVLSVRLQSEGGQLSELEEQLSNCRTLRTDPIPFVDTEASLRVVDSYSAEQRRQAEAYTAAVAACTDFACLQKANQLPRAPGQFHYPAFFVIGFPKCATTSLYCHLIEHIQVQHPKEKESHWLSQQCEKPSFTFSKEAQRHYIVDILNLQQAARAQFTKAAFEGSTHYVLEAGWMAEQLAATLPWLKVVISMRDPISQAIAMHLHNVAHGRAANCTEDLSETSIYHCIRRSLKPGSKSHYSSKVQKWMEFFPRERLHILQFENLTRPEAMSGVMQGLKSFLGLDPHLPSDTLPLTNYKHQRGGEDALGRYWILKRWELEHLVEIAHNSTMEVVSLLEQHGYASKQEKQEWLRNWERVWEDNLGRCEEGRSAPCKVIVS